MQITCDKASLTDALSICIHAVAPKSSYATLEGVLITIGEDTITLCGYNTQMGIERTIEAQSDAGGRFIMPAHLFFDVVKAIQGDRITIALDENLNATVSSGKSVFNIKAEEGSEFPELPIVNKNNGVTLPSNLLRSMINDTIYAISTNENKPVHMGSKFEVESGVLRIISIDGYRLAVRREDVQTQGGESFGFVVPGSTLKELTRILPDNDDPVSVYPGGKHGLFEFGETIVTTRLLEGDFLDFRSAVPNDMPINMVVDKGDITNAVERVSVVITERLKNPVRCLFEGDSLKVSCTTALGKAFDEIPMPFNNDTIEIGFNSRYLLDALRACPEEKVSMELKSSLSPVIFRPIEGDRFLFMVLPVRLKAEGI